MLFSLPKKKSHKLDEKLHKIKLNISKIMIQGLSNDSKNVEIFATGSDVKSFYKGSIISIDELPSPIIDILLKKCIETKRQLQQ